MIPSFEERVQQWSNPPVDDVGYLSSTDLMRMPKARLKLTIGEAERTRYGGWRNHNNMWRKILRMNTTKGKLVLDYGCGIGIEALQYARSSNDVVVADISRQNMLLAQEVLRLFGFKAGGFQITPDHLVDSFFGEFDVIHSAGVLHHIPDPVPVVQAMAAQLAPYGELRLMVYSDEAWRIACGTEPPAVVEEDPGFERYWRRWDAVGGYADWYSADRLVERFGQWFTLEDYGPVTKWGEYVAAVLRKR